MNTLDDSYRKYLGSPEWKSRARERLMIDKGRCAMCGSMGTVENPIECHHLSYRNIGHEDIYTDLVSLCRGCHKGVHRLMERTTSRDGRKGWLDAPRIPTVHIFTLDGTKTELMEE